MFWRYCNWGQAFKQEARKISIFLSDFFLVFLAAELWPASCPRASEFTAVAGRSKARDT
jgi:hypothetical protein